MAELDLEKLSLKELKALRTQLDRAIATYEDRRKREAREELEETARALGFTLAELVGAPVLRKRSNAPPKYANPANSGDTWSGRGRRPRWFEEALARGQSADELKI
ncbi:H-NS family nucleoid-associated regulatory protein (plasmid) [Cereibacter azotoformans]|uniref:DNA-binding protein H-NS n=1 Tax=Cereibacter azotoformans TaxID=43057 RepID=A0A2T5JTA1_9RHOB|nr:H-NS histone family protein [Cereibacter sediminicola]PTR13405.1 DNA-binding protein H-NS [Cereibacter azotoformans]